MSHPDGLFFNVGGYSDISFLILVYEEALIREGGHGMGCSIIMI
jgi:hypothetical protein